MSVTTNVVSLTELKVDLNANIDDDIPTIVLGPTGVGKSDMYKEIARDRGWDGVTDRRSLMRRKGYKPPAFGYLDFRACLRETIDLRGLPKTDEETTRWLAPDELPQVERDGEEGIVVLEELPQANAQMQTGCFSLVLDRYVGEYHLPKGWRIGATGNRVQDRSGANRLLKAFANRFAHYEVAPDVDAWIVWAQRMGVHPLVEAFIRFRPQFLHQMPEGEENAFPTPRAWATVSKVCASAQSQESRFRRVRAIVGQSAAVEFEGYVRIWSQVPDIDTIFKNPGSVKVPTLQDPSVLYATAAAIARRVSRTTLSNAAIYLGKLPKEYEVVGMVAAARRDPDLKETRTFGTWFANNSEVLI